jgi:hypothetical protein
MRILIPSIVNPAVERNGASTVTRGLTELLQRPPLEAELDLLPARIGPARWHRLTQARSFLHSWISPLPAKFAFLYSRSFRRDVTGRLRDGRYDLVILNGSDLIWLLPYLPASMPRLLIAHNLEYEMYGSRIRALGRLPPPLGAILQHDRRRLETCELAGLRAIRHVIFLSQQDADQVADGCRLNAFVVPPVFSDLPAARPVQTSGDLIRVGYLGNFDWWPNRTGLRWFVDEVLPHVTSPVQLNLFGKGSERCYPGHSRLRRHGVVEPIEEVWRDCDFLICPAFADSGVNVKLAEAVHHRMPVLTNRQGLRGLGLPDDPAIVLREGSEEWIRFLNSPSARSLARPGDGTVARFSVAAHQTRVQDFVAGVVRNGAS